MLTPFVVQGFRSSTNCAFWFSAHARCVKAVSLRFCRLILVQSILQRVELIASLHCSEACLVQLVR